MQTERKARWILNWFSLSMLTFNTLTGLIVFGWQGLLIVPTTLLVLFLFFNEA